MGPSDPDSRIGCRFATVAGLVLLAECFTVRVAGGWLALVVASRDDVVAAKLELIRRLGAGSGTSSPAACHPSELRGAAHTPAGANAIPINAANASELLLVIEASLVS